MDSGHDHMPEGFVPATEYNDLMTKYDRLQKEYANYRREAEERSRRAADKIHRAKERIRAWQQYIEKKRAKQAAHGNAPLAQDEVPISLAHPTVEAVRNASASASHSPMPSKITSSQTTQGEMAVPSSPAADTDEDVPVVVSARSLKRKRDTPKPTKIKKEHLSSSPLDSHSGIPPLLRTQTSDLDVLNEQNRLRQSQRPRSGFRNNAEWADPASTVNRPHPLSLEQEHISNRGPSLSQVSAADRPPRRDSSAEDVAGTGDHSHIPSSSSTVKTVKTDPGADTQHLSAEISPTRMSRSFGPQRTTGGPLHDLSPNTPNLRGKVSDVSSRKKDDRSHGAAAVHAVSEDGENIPRSTKKLRIRDNQDTPKRGAGRLEDLLEGTTPQIDKTILSPRSAPAVRRQREVPPTSSKSAEKPNSRSKRPARFDIEDPGPVLPEHEPLRSRPLHHLNIDDFKINPNYSDQLGFAYRETIRKREQRRCLPGCTRPECCGAILEFVQAGGLPNMPRQAPLFSAAGGPTLSDDELTLQGYLGAGYAQTIHKASLAERQKMLVEARAKAFADRHGKHRQAFERRTTPPGFWRTDMPSTQEMEQDREEARKLERQKVEERWRDAMRGYGRYMFRDE